MVIAYTANPACRREPSQRASPRATCKDSSCDCLASVDGVEMKGKKVVDGKGKGKGDGDSSFDKHYNKELKVSEGNFKGDFNL